MLLFVSTVSLSVRFVRKRSGASSSRGGGGHGFASELTDCLSVDELAGELTNCLSVDEFASELTNCLSVDDDDDDDDLSLNYYRVLAPILDSACKKHPH